jgi:S1-C subfamily serine protease
MIALDWAIVFFAVVMALWGYRQGLVVGALTLTGFAVGAVIGGRAAPALLADGSDSPYAPLMALSGALLLGGLVALSVEGAALALRRRLIRGNLSAIVDGSGGAILIGALALGIAWLFGAAALNAPDQPQLRKTAQRSAILRGLNDLLPASGFVVGALRRIDPGLELSRPGANVAPPDPRLSVDPQVTASEDSVVRVLGTACGLGVEGSGWAAAPDLIVTNAHVIAGQEDTTVTALDDGTRRDAVPVYFDTDNDIAVLRVLGLAAEPLSLAPSAEAGTAGALLGYPENGPFHATPVRVGATASGNGEDAYGNGPVRRSITSLRGHVRSGNSGGPVVDGEGRVLTTVFAATADGRQGGFGVPNEVVSQAIAGSGSQVGTGPCAE